MAAPRATVMPSSRSVDPYQYYRFKYNDLKRMASQRRLDPRGKRFDLIERLNAQDTERPFKLLDLPKDIRCVIYEILLCDPIPERDPNYIEARMQDGDKTVREQVVEPPILKVSRAIRQESIPYYFRLKKWEFGARIDREMAFLRRLKRWLTRIGPSVRSIRTFMICLPIGNGMIFKSIAEEITPLLPKEATITYVIFNRILSEPWTVSRTLCIQRRCKGWLKITCWRGVVRFDGWAAKGTKKDLPQMSAPDCSRPFKIVLRLDPVR